MPSSRRQSTDNVARPTSSAELVAPTDDHVPVTAESSSLGTGGARRPKSDAFRQQRLTAWQPMLSAKTVIPFFALVGILFVPVGIGLLLVSLNHKEIIFDYTNCQSTTLQSHLHSRTTCSAALKPPATCTCEQPFTLSGDGMPGDVNIYYALDNFYQNHRHYVKSRDDYQLLGHLEDGSTVSTDCAPFDHDARGVPIAPCGAIANSMFNDTFDLYYVIPSEPPRRGIRIPPPAPHSRVPLLRTGIAWWSDRQVKFRNPANLADFQRYARPVNWSKNITQLDEEIPSNNGFQNEDFIVWMRPAAFSDFRKLHRRLNRWGVSNSPYKDGLPAGNYVMYINYNFPVVGFEGRKKFVISTASWLGAKNPLIGSMYIAVGGLCLILAVVFLVLHKKWGNSMARNYAEGDAPPPRRNPPRMVDAEE